MTSDFRLGLGLGLARGSKTTPCVNGRRDGLELLFDRSARVSSLVSRLSSLVLLGSPHLMGPKPKVSAPRRRKESRNRDIFRRCRGWAVFGINIINESNRGCLGTIHQSFARGRTLNCEAGSGSADTKRAGFVTQCVMTRNTRRGISMLGYLVAHFRRPSLSIFGNSVCLACTIDRIDVYRGGVPAPTKIRSLHAN